jgi:hypothetical protein
VCSPTLGKEAPFAERLLVWHSAKKALAVPFASSFTDSFGWHSAKGTSLLSARTTTLDK